MFNPAPISPASGASLFHLSPSLHSHSNSAREDSSVEPRALRPARWPSSHHDYTPPPTRRLPRSLTAPANSFSSLRRKALSFESDSSLAFDQPRPVQLSPGLTPSMRDTLPQPKALRPQPPPHQSDLSAASTRAENEPLAVRDLRRVTAPPALMDPWQYDRLKNRRQRDRERDHRNRVNKSLTTHSAHPQRHDTSRDKYSVSDQNARWRATARASRADRNFARRRWFHRTEVPLPRIPDRFHDTIEECVDRQSLKEDSVISAITRESDPPEDNQGMRWRSQSEMLVRRSSFAVGKEKVMSFWERLRRRRRRANQSTQERAPDRRGPQLNVEEQNAKEREPRAKLPLFASLGVGVSGRGNR